MQAEVIPTGPLGTCSCNEIRNIRESFYTIRGMAAETLGVGISICDISRTCSCKAMDFRENNDMVQGLEVQARKVEAAARIPSLPGPPFVAWVQ